MTALSRSARDLLLTDNPNGNLCYAAVRAPLVLAPNPVCRAVACVGTVHLGYTI
jgi:hypothetical protein